MTFHLFLPLPREDGGARLRPPSRSLSPSPSLPLRSPPFLRCGRCFRRSPPPLTGSWSPPASDLARHRPISEAAAPPDLQLTEMEETTAMDAFSSSSADPFALKFALVMALLRFKKQHQISSSPPSSNDDVVRWKKKAKERKRELLLLREELKQLEDETRREVVPQISSCRCHFFDDLGKPSPAQSGAPEHWIDEVLRRRFLRLLRWKERRSLDAHASSKRLLGGTSFETGITDFNNEDEIEGLRTSIDFLVEISTKQSVDKDSSFQALSHQALDLILVSVKKLSRKDQDLIEEILSRLIMRLNEALCSIRENAESPGTSPSAQVYIQHLIRKLGKEQFIGQRIMLSVSQSISIQAERLLFMDPFDDAFPRVHGGMYMMIQLMEFLILDCLRDWTNTEEFDWRLFEEWMRSMLQSQKDLKLLECRNSLYLLYVERVIGEIAKRIAPAAAQGKLSADILSLIFS